MLLAIKQNAIQPQVFMSYNWYKNTVIYSLDVEIYYDSNNDGIGDFQGLIKKLDYIASLGVTCMWLLPFYPSPNRDNGYDVKDYYDVDERLGTLGDFSEFINLATDKGLRVIIDLVVNHTSIEHKWFQEARRDKNSKYRNYYVWADEPLAFEREHLMFVGEEDSLWTYDEEAGQYYLHRFYKEQPDLNVSNPEVVEEIKKIMSFWLQMGVSGFRVDAAEILIESYGMDHGETGELEGVLEEMRSYINSINSDAILLAETNINPDKMGVYLDEGRRMHMLFNFYVNQHLFLAGAEQKPDALVKALLRLPETDEQTQWLNFLRHHDELSLSLLTKEEREKVFERFAPQEEMRIYGRGIRRRLAPMLEWDKSLLKMVHSLLFSLPGVPLIRYGDEIAMGDDLSQKGRESVRTVMQWSDAENGGFSTAPREQIVKPVIDNEQCGFKKINVLASQKDPDSFYNWILRLISIRKQCPAIGMGVMNIIETTHKKLLVHTYKHGEDQVLMLHNFSSEKIVVTVEELGMQDFRLADLLVEDIQQETNKLELQGKGYRWLRVYQ